MSSKAAQVKLVEYLAAENPQMLVCSVHPGVVETAMLERAELVGMPVDTGMCYGDVRIVPTRLTFGGLQLSYRRTFSCGSHMILREHGF